MKMKTEDFGLSILARAASLYRAMRRNIHHDNCRGYWLIPYLLKPRFRDECVKSIGLYQAGMVDRVNLDTLHGLPIRYTVGDDPTTPEIELVVEPTFIQ